MKDVLLNLSNLSEISDSRVLNEILSELDKEERDEKNNCSVKDTINKFQEYRTNIEKTKMVF